MKVFIYLQMQDEMKVQACLLFLLWL